MVVAFVVWLRCLILGVAAMLFLMLIVRLGCYAVNSVDLAFYFYLL